ncbi:MAG TPA: fatty acid desaturase [Rhizomicrobium sp.]|nr:fatty acid desaturase [Rhizomicrobium sp.]
MRKTVLDLGLLTLAGVVATVEFGVYPRLFPLTGWSLTAFVTLVALTAPLHYGLMHETMHGNLFANERWNRVAGRLLGITLGLPFETMRFGHLAHHSNNRHSFDRPEYLAPGQSYFAVAPGFYFKTVIGNALIYALLPLLIFVPMPVLERYAERANQTDDAGQVRSAALRSFSNPARRNTLRIDLAGIVLFAGVALYLWGSHWWVFAACVLARWSVLSLLDNAPHYAMPLTSGLEARNTTMPAALRWLILNQNFHGEHHLTPKRHWSELPAAFRQSQQAANGSWIAAVLRQFRGPVELS